MAIFGVFHGMEKVFHAMEKVFHSMEKKGRILPRRGKSFPCYGKSFPRRGSSGFLGMAVALGWLACAGGAGAQENCEPPDTGGWPSRQCVPKAVGLGGALVAVAALGVASSMAARARRGRQRLELLLEAMEEGVVGIGPDDVCIFCNRAALGMLGLREEELVGRRQHDVFHSRREDGSPYPWEECPVRATLLDGERRNGEDLFWRSNGESFPASYALSPLLDGGRRAGAVLVFCEVTARKRAENLLAAKNKEMERVVYVASHDLRTPLVNVDGYGRELGYVVEDIGRALDAEGLGEAERLARVRAALPEMEESLKRVRAGTKQMDTLLKGLLDYSRRGRSAMQIGALDMDALAARVVAAMEYQIREAGARVRVGRLPPCRGDESQVEGVFLNVLGNALKYLDPSRPGEIEIGGEEAYGQSSYWVRDNGVGMTPEQCEKVFELSYRAEPGRTDGDGLGLPSARQALGRMGGEIWAESTPGQGSRFHVALPRDR
jgi:PAS domain S-box-containing protein